MSEELLESRGTCALDGCENPLPPPARDERGRLKGGKPVRYCTKAHADEASRRRRALEAVGVEEPLHVLRALGEQTAAVMDAALAEFAAIRQRWDEVDAGAVARSAADRAETAAALLKVEQAERAVDEAERGRAEAVAAAARDGKLRAEAEQAAEQARQEAEQVRRTAWEKTAEHERARGQAETRALLAEQGQREALNQVAALRDELRQVVAAQQETARQLAEQQARAERAEAARELAESRATAAGEQARLAGDAVRRAEQATERAQAATETARAAEQQAREAEQRAREAAQAATEQVAHLRADKALAEQRLADLDTHTRQRTDDLRAQLDAALERERLLAARVPQTPQPLGSPATTGEDPADPRQSS